jgi:hypothetical protein
MNPTPALTTTTHPTPAATAAMPSRVARELTDNERAAANVVAALVGALGLLGFANSFTAVMAAARPSFGGMAATVPLGIDLGIGIFAALDIVLARLDMRLRWLRLIPWTLTAATVYLNVAGEATAFGRVAHAVLPALWVIAVEVAAHVVRVRAGIEAGTRMDTIRVSRWLLAPWPTLKLWRRMTLWEIRSYPAALDKERNRLLALTDLQDTYGRFAWRWKTPRRTRALYRLGELTPTPTDPPANAADATADVSAVRMADTAPTARPARRPATRPAAARTGVRTGKARGSGRPADREADALALLTADPNLSGAELGRRLGVTERTGRRIHERVKPLLTPTPDAPATLPAFAPAETATAAAPAALEGTAA